MMLGSDPTMKIDFGTVDHPWAGVQMSARYDRGRRNLTQL